MNDWTSGYVSEIEYTHGYYQELNPLRARLALIYAGIHSPELGIHCELGFGQGISVNMHAAASQGTWYATDFNPAQAGFAKDLARISGADAHLYDDAFVDFCAREDLPDFDSIGLHGIWSWISVENRDVIVDFIRRKLKVGGVVYVSYNTLPGFTPMIPMRELITEHSKLLSAPGTSLTSRISSAIDFCEKFAATNPLYLHANPSIAEWLQSIKKHNRNYLAHEYFNRDWQPMSFLQMADCLSSAKLEFACSAHFLDSLDPVNVSEEQQAFLKDIPDRLFREMVRDFMKNQRFRRDYWVKGAQKLNPLEQLEALRLQKIVLTKPRKDVPLKVSNVLREGSLSEKIYTPILDVLSHHKLQSIGQIEQAVAKEGIKFNQLAQAVTILVGSGHASVAADEAQISKSQASSDKLNAHLVSLARASESITTLASPVLGGGFGVDRLQQLFMYAMSLGKKTDADCVHTVWQLLAMQGQNLMKDGVALKTPEEGKAELTRRLDQFNKEQMPILKALHVRV